MINNYFSFSAVNHDVEIDDLDRTVRLARAEAFAVIPWGCTCSQTVRLWNQPGNCRWCNTFSAVRLGLEAEALSIRLTAVRERIAQTKRDLERTQAQAPCQNPVLPSI